MNIKVLLIFTFWGIASLSYSQVSYEYSNPNLFEGESIVFTEEYSPPIIIPEEKEMFTPDEEAILLAEEILVDRFNKDVEWTEKKKEVKKKFWNYHRQYLGFIDNNGEKFILINLLNFKHKKKARNHFKGWKEFFFVGHGEYYEKNTIRLLANLDTGKLMLF